MMKFATKCIHAGVHPDPSTGAIMTPIYQTSTYVQEAPGKHQGFEYARSQNPTRAVLEENLAALENGQHAISFASGLAAMDTVLRLFEPGDEILGTNDLYGGSYRLLTKVHERYGIKPKFVPMTAVDELEAHITPQTKLLWIETPTNPMLTVVDIKAICELAKSKGILTCVDNTFASPFLQNPLDMGADMVLHSATKYLGGHSDLIHGAVMTNHKDIAERLRFLQNAVGAVPGPQDCFLLLRGIKTLHLRVERSCQNAVRIAQFLKDHPKVNNVYYPGLVEHPQHDLAKRQMRYFGGMVSFDLHTDTLAYATDVLSNTNVFSLAESLGGVESLIGHPASMTHASIPRVERLKVGLTDSLVRLSVGVEDIDDLTQDLDQALNQLK
ncbi:MAG TPA: cystathionine gamma-synthase [Saprospiraceae bacterium]|nr:cystathionine gamma-synthase [Saprospiraceae bacterium]